ncbi:MAG: LytR C-terminal domain-containing protein [Gaiellaceae bacterium]
MEHALPQPTSWRTATLVVAAVAAVELAILIALALPMLGRAVAEDVRTAAVERVFAPAAKPEPAKSAPILVRGDTSVTVLNGNGVTGAANVAGERVQGLGYLIAEVGNAPRSDYPRTIVMYRPGRQAEAKRLARDIGAKVVGPLDGLRVRDLMGAHLALILGPR